MRPGGGRRRSACCHGGVGRGPGLGESRGKGLHTSRPAAGVPVSTWGWDWAVEGDAGVSDARGTTPWWRRAAQHPSAFRLGQGAGRERFSLSPLTPPRAHEPGVCSLSAVLAPMWSKCTCHPLSDPGHAPVRCSVHNRILEPHSAQATRQAQLSSNIGVEAQRVSQFGGRSGLR